VRYVVSTFASTSRALSEPTRRRPSEDIAEQLVDTRVGLTKRRHGRVHPNDRGGL
jgi:hypothetical protein